VKFMICAALFLMAYTLLYAAAGHWFPALVQVYQEASSGS